MSIFEGAVEFVLGNEGGISENPNDSGGLTNFGLSLRFLKSFGDKYDFNKNGILEDDIRNLTEAQAIKIYYNEFWAHAPFEKIQNGWIGNMLFDSCVLHGMSVGIKIAQRAVWAVHKQKDYILDDGILGAKTISAINYAGFQLIPAMMSERAGFCRFVAAKNGKDQTFLNGWLKRCYRYE